MGLAETIQRDQEGAHSTKWQVRRAFVEQWKHRTEPAAAQWIASVIDGTGYLSEIPVAQRRDAYPLVGQGIVDHMTERDALLAKIAKPGMTSEQIEAAQRRVIEINQWLEGVLPR